MSRATKVQSPAHRVVQWKGAVVRGYFGVGILNGKTEVNLGTLWRSAANLGAGFIFTIGRRYKRQASDTTCAWRHVPLFEYETFDDFWRAGLPFSCPLVGVELDERAEPLPAFRHPERAVYLLGAEDGGLTTEARDRCHHIVQIPSAFCLNVAVAGSIVMYDRTTKRAASTDRGER